MSSLRRFDNKAIIVDLLKIERILNTDSAEKRRFLSNFQKWTMQRRHTLSQLKKLKTELDDIYHKANIGKCIGTGVSIVGGLAALIGFGLSLSIDGSTCSTGKNISSYGLGAGVLGTTTSFVASAAECKVNQRILSEVKSTIERDQQLTRELIPYLEESETLDSLFQKVFGCDVLSDTVEDIFAVVQGITTLCKEGIYAYQEISMIFTYSMYDCMYDCSTCLELENIKKIFQRLGKKVQLVLLEFCENPKVREAVLKIVQAVKRSPITFDVSKVCLRVLLRMSSMAKNLDFSTSDILASLFAKATANVGHILIRSISVAIEIVALIRIANDIANSESKYSGMVENIESFLAKELYEANSLVNRFSINQIRMPRVLF